MNKPLLYVNFFKVFWKVANQAHRDYVGTDMPHGQAASFEALLAFNNFANKLGKVSVLDAGAGASSCLLRAWFDNVITCDPDSDYLVDVKKACKEVMFSLSSMADDAWVLGYPKVEVDCCFYDYGTTCRKAFLGLALTYTRRLVYVDDADTRSDCLDMRRYARGLVELYNDGVEVTHRWNWHDCVEAEDEHGRWGVILTR